MKTKDNKHCANSQLIQELKAFKINLGSGWYRNREEIITKLNEIIFKNG